MPDFDDLVDGGWDDIYTQIARELLENPNAFTNIALYNKTAEKLMDGVFAGLNGKDFAENDSRFDLLKAFKTNIEAFAYSKTLTQFKHFKDNMFDANGTILSADKVKKMVADQGAIFNNQYLKVEHQFVTQSAIMADKWNNLDSEYLEFSTVGDSRVRQSHRLFDKFTALKTDPIWRRLYTPLDWNCRCTIIPGIAKNLSKEYDSVWAEKVVEPMVKGTIFDNNVGITNVIFKENHPYFKAVENNKIDYKNYSIHQLKESYKNQNIDKEKESIIMNNGYVATSNAFDINEKLRKKIDLSDKDKQTVNALDDLIKANKLKDNVMLYRNVKNDFVKNTFGVDIDGLTVLESIKKLKDVDIINYSEKAFFSTSAVKDANAFKFRNIHLEIRANKGTNALIVDNYSESEIILGRNQKFKIINIFENNNKIKLILETD